MQNHDGSSQCFLAPAPAEAWMLGDERRSGQTLAEAIIEEFDYGVLLLDDAGELVSANSIGMAALRDGWALTLRGRQVAASASSDAIRWLGLRNRAAKGMRGMDLFGQTDDRIAIAVAPIRTSGRPQSAAIIVTMGRRSACDRFSLESFARLHRLTAAEQRVLEGIVAGIPPVKIAARHGVSVSTIRTQIGHLLQKSGCSSMRMLLSEVARLPPLRPALFPAWTSADDDGRSARPLPFTTQRAAV